MGKNNDEWGRGLDRNFVPPSKKFASCSGLHHFKMASDSDLPNKWWLARKGPLETHILHQPFGLSNVFGHSIAFIRHADYTTKCLVVVLWRCISMRSTIMETLQW